MNPAIDKNLSEYMDLHHVEYVWLPFSGNHNDEFVDIYTNKSLNAQWLPPKQDITGNHLNVSLVLAYGPGKGKLIFLNHQRQGSTAIFSIK